MQRAVLLLDEHSDAADKVYRVAYALNSPRSEGIAPGIIIFYAAPRLSTGNADSFRVPDTTDNQENAIPSTSLGGEGHR